MFDQNETKYFVYFEDLLSFCIFAIYDRGPLKLKRERYAKITSALRQKREGSAKINECRKAKTEKVRENKKYSLGTLYFRGTFPFSANISQY